MKATSILKHEDSSGARGGLCTQAADAAAKLRWSREPFRKPWGSRPPLSHGPNLGPRVPESLAQTQGLCAVWHREAAFEETFGGWSVDAVLQVQTTWLWQASGQAGTGGSRRLPFLVFHSKKSRNFKSIPVILGNHNGRLFKVREYKLFHFRLQSLFGVRLYVFP
ncbi:uncharacterized protein [Vulpes vulpes]|uniref:Uncharacterized protein isoform X3 n=1 Tax=Vulpes vulpes TaxID=9627 RepID=A0ABM5B6X2_VULVU